jgi:hypothetical protein
VTCGDADPDLQARAQGSDLPLYCRDVFDDEESALDTVYMREAADGGKRDQVCREIV